MPLREPLTIVEVSQDFCTLRYGVAPCTAALGASMIRAAVPGGIVTRGTPGDDFSVQVNGLVSPRYRATFTEQFTPTSQELDYYQYQIFANIGTDIQTIFESLAFPHVEGESVEHEFAAVGGAVNYSFRLLSATARELGGLSAQNYRYMAALAPLGGNRYVAVFQSPTDSSTGAAPGEGRFYVVSPRFGGLDAFTNVFSDPFPTVAQGVRLEFEIPDAGVSPGDQLQFGAEWRQNPSSAWVNWRRFDRVSVRDLPALSTDETFTVTAANMPSHAIPAQAPNAESARKCYNTFATCQDQPNFTQGNLTLRFGHARAGYPKEIAAGQTPIFPALRSVSSVPTTLNPAGTDRRYKALGRRASVRVTLDDFAYNDSITDPYQPERISGAAQADGAGYDPEKRGTFFGRWRARNPFYNARSLIIREGFAGQPLSEFVSRQYFIDKIEGPNDAGSITITAKDPLKLAEDDRAVAPRPSTGKLAVLLGVEVDRTDTLTGLRTYEGRLEVETESIRIALEGVQRELAVLLEKVAREGADEELEDEITAEQRRAAGVEADLQAQINAIPPPPDP